MGIFGIKYLIVNVKQKMIWIIECVQANDKLIQCRDLKHW